MKKTITTITIILFSLQVSAQIEAITEKGDTIQIYENGTWEKLNQVEQVEQIETSVTATTTVDEFDKSKKITTESWTKFGKDNSGRIISGKLIRVDELTVFSISYSGDLGCFSEYSSTMKVKLANGEVIEFSQISDTDCGDYPTARFIPLTREQLKDPEYKDVMTDNMELLKNYDWETIRLNGSEYYTDISPNQSKKITNPEQFFRQHIIAADKE